jgi:hypothetical protein
MRRKNLHATLYFFDRRDEPDVRSTVAGALHCRFPEADAKSDEFRTTWFGGAFGFEIMFYLVSQRGDGAWYSVNIGPSDDISDPEAPLEEIEFHLAQVLRKAGFGTIVTMDEYYDQHHKPEA